MLRMLRRHKPFPGCVVPLNYRETYDRSVPLRWLSSGRELVADRLSCGAETHVVNVFSFLYGLRSLFIPSKEPKSTSM